MAGGYVLHTCVLMCCVQGRTDSGHLYVMDPADMLSTGARGIGSSPLRFEMTETGHPGAPLLRAVAPSPFWLHVLMPSHTEADLSQTSDFFGESPI